MSVTFRHSRALAALQLTPLIDMVFLLLIFFLVATRFADEDRELEVDLPTASESRPLMEQAQQLFVHIDGEGHVFVGSREVAADGLEAELRRVRQERPGLETVVLRADRRCAWDRVAQAINTCHRVGLHDIRPTTAAEGSP